MGDNMSQTISSRGGQWVIAQFVLLPCLAALTWFTRAPAPWPASIAGIAIMLAGVALVGVAVLHLGESFTPFPKPLARGALKTGGAYAIVRHPIYAGVVWGMVGLALLAWSLIGAASAAFALVFFALKARREERWLADAYPGYRDYARRVKRFVPLIF
jgi:protein-S-isoprenylcysteine O-methyltransferase Ste14